MFNNIIAEISKRLENHKINVAANKMGLKDIASHNGKCPSCGSELRLGRDKKGSNHPYCWKCQKRMVTFVIRKGDLPPETYYSGISKRTWEKLESPRGAV